MNPTCLGDDDDDSNKTYIEIRIDHSEDVDAIERGINSKNIQLLTVCSNEGCKNLFSVKPESLFFHLSLLPIY